MRRYLHTCATVGFDDGKDERMPTTTDDNAACQLGTAVPVLDTVRESMTTLDEATAMTDLFKLLGEPTRLRMLSALVEAGELNVRDLAASVDASEQKVSQGLRLLRGAGIVANRRVGRTVHYRVTSDQVRQLLGLSLEQTSVPVDESPHIGSIERISYAPNSGDPLVVVDQIVVDIGTGIQGNRPGENSARQVSIQSRAELDLAEKRLGRPIHSDQTRRNITIDAGELPRVRGQRLLLGTVELEVFSDAPPCATMTRIIGTGARPALRKLGGIHCRVIRAGTIRTGDDLHLGRAPRR